MIVSARASYIILTMLVWVKVKGVGAVVPLLVGQGSKLSAMEPWSLGAPAPERKPATTVTTS